MFQYFIAWITKIGGAEVAFFSEHPYLIVVAGVAIIGATMFGLHEPKVHKS